MNFNQWSSSANSSMEFIQNSSSSSFSAAMTAFTSDGNTISADVNIAVNQNIGWYDFWINYVVR